MTIEVTAWSGAQAPSQEAILNAFRAEGLSPYSWSNGPGDRYGAHSHSYFKVLYCARGSIVFEVEGEEIEMKPGDRLDLPAGTGHSAVVGPRGCTCYEAHR
ncbi:MAG: cupin domain-containing protein [Actinomycetota bacterium]